MHITYVHFHAYGLSLSGPNSWEIHIVYARKNHQLDTHLTAKNVSDTIGQKPYSSEHFDSHRLSYTSKSVLCFLQVT